MATMYVDSKFNDYKDAFTAAVKEQYDGPLYGCAIRIVAEFRFGTKRRKDLSNAGKLEFDALNGIIYVDDSQISTITSKKTYSKESPGITLQVYSDEESVWAYNPKTPEEV